jgi:hypothetical protein
MIAMRSFRILLCLLLILALAAFPAAAQEDDTEAREFVLQAIANLAALPGYHFAYEMQAETTFAGEEDETTTATITSVEGDALADGDNFVTISTATGESLDAAQATPPLHVERTVFNGKSALNFQLEDTVYEDLLPFEQGWQSYEDLSASLEGITEQITLDNINNTLLPTAFFADASLIESVSEAASEEIDGIPMRVFDVELNALGLMLERTPADQRADLQSFFETLNVLEGGDLSTTYRLWIGAEDGQIYRGTIRDESNFPYLSSGQEDAAPYDIIMTTNIDLTISQHGEAADIEPVVLPD